MAEMNPLGAWCEQRGLLDLVLISPHLDDGVFSAHSALTASYPSGRLLATVFSSAPPEGQSEWGLRTGFATNREEFAARRLEDQAAADAVGVPCLHFDEFVETWSDAAALRVADRLLSQLHGAPSSALVLLPAGAGRLTSSRQRLWNRITRRPFGPPEHGEHLMARDRLYAPLQRSGLRLGFYAELPYAWSDRMSDLARRVRQFSGQAMVQLNVSPDVSAKHAAAACYTSQLEPILGSDPGYQRRALSHPEVFFLPE